MTFRLGDSIVDKAEEALKTMLSPSLMEKGVSLRRQGRMAVLQDTL